ncbi:phage tail sheath family protein [Streptomyces noursei]|uniref:Tail protein n=1 Tax=Streptomyces noursei TaxID=1971 RepID=A0A059VPR9_STRNR|nr:putative phage tail sheath protein [Streptomyces noursei]GCB89001.1 tail protein [Streptomyces noursei]
MRDVIEVGGTSERPPGGAVDQAPSGARFVGSAPTSVAVFLAETSGGGERPPTKLASWKGFEAAARLADGASDAEQTTRRILVSKTLWAAVHGWFANGGGECYLAPVVGPGGLADTLKQLESLDEIAIVLAPDLWSGTTDQEASQEAAGLIADHCQQMADRVAVLHLPNEAPPGNVAATLGVESAEARRYATAYYPWINVQDPGDPNAAPLTVPAIGHAAGVWARVDQDRGVHKAPANEGLRGVLGLTHELSDAEHRALNDQGVNAIRNFPGSGPLIWGARTLAAADETEVENSYLNVRRAVNSLRRSIRRSTTWAVFEPNDERLQTSVRAMVTSFLTGLWRRGVLVGRSAEEAFYVVCDETNNPPEKGSQGKLLVQIGVALVRPAEFITFQVDQITERSS